VSCFLAVREPISQYHLEAILTIVQIHTLIDSLPDTPTRPLTHVRISQLSRPTNSAGQDQADVRTRILNTYKKTAGNQSKPIPPTDESEPALDPPSDLPTTSSPIRQSTSDHGKLCGLIHRLKVLQDEDSTSRSVCSNNSNIIGNVAAWRIVKVA
jgi:hypothetical protein